MYDGRQYPGRREKGTGRLLFHRGFITRVLSELPAVIENPPPAPVITAPVVEGLRDYQQEALTLIFARRWGRMALPTNAGKGAIIAIAAATLASVGMASLILCDEIAVFKALKEEVRRWAKREPVLIEAGAATIPPGGSITIAMVPTLSRRKDKAWLDWFKTISGVFLDEGDKATSKTWGAVTSRCENSHYRIGFSGTFLDSEFITPSELILSELIGPVLMRKRNIDMIERGISARPKVELVPYTQKAYILNIPPRKQWADMTGPERRQWVYERGVVLNIERHNLVVRLLDTDYPNAVIVNYIQHGLELAQVVPSSMFLHGASPKEEREEVLTAFKKGEFQNLIASQILDRGSNDLGHAAGLVFASSMGSERQTLQRIGRGLRRSGGKEFLYLKDILDRGHTFFEGPSRDRLMLYNEEGFEVTIRNEGE